MIDVYENMEMRQAFALELDKYMAADPRICIVDADLSKANGRAGLHKKYPDRAFNVGVAEANMIGICAGLSSYGMIPFASSFTPFATRRVCDQIAVSCAYAKQNVKIVGTDPGLSAEFNGGTHMSVEDIGVVRSIPEVVIFEPVDNTQLVKALPQIIAHPGVVYIRLWRKVTPDVFKDDDTFDLFKAAVILAGTDVTIFCSGMMVDKALKARRILAAEGIEAEIVNVHTIKPIDRETVVRSVRKTRCAVSAENHNVVGGLYSALAEAIVSECPVPMEAIGIQDRFGQVGKLGYLVPEYGMTETDVAAAARRAISRK